MKIRWMAFFFAFLLISAPAEENVLWSGADDPYLHETPFCMERTDLLPLSDTEGKSPCPVCTECEPCESVITGTYSGDFALLRVPDTIMDSLSGWYGIFADTSRRELSEAEAVDALAVYLHGEPYVQALESKLAGDDFEVRAVYPDFYGAQYRSHRHIGNAWYIAVDLNEDVDTSSESVIWSGEARYFFGRLFQEDGIFYKQFTDELSVDASAVLSPAGESQCVRCGAYEACLTPMGDVSLCVIRFEADDLGTLYTLRIGGMPAVHMQYARADGAQRIYACTLTSAEAEAILSGTEFDLLYDVDYSIASYCSTPYALVGIPYGWSDYYVLLDRSGNEIMRFDGYTRRDGNQIIHRNPDGSETEFDLASLENQTD